MFDVKKIREDFPVLKQKMQEHDLIYFDSGATTLKPKPVIDAVVDYYQSYTSNVHRGDYDLSHKADTAYENAREKVAKFINAKEKREIIFTSGTSESINLVAKGFFAKRLKKDDEILLTHAEHASNILPWFDLKTETGAKVKFIDLDNEGRLTLDNVKKAITEKTKVLSIAHITNVLGFIAPVNEICEYAKSKGIYVVIDGAQSVPHLKTDVLDMNCDFLAFSAHKMLGPTGIGVLYGKYELLEEMNAFNYGGGMNARFDACGNISLKKPPYKFESGTPNIEGAIGLGAAIDYLSDIGMDNIHKHELELKKYAVEKLSEIDNIELYNPTSESGIIAFNVKDVFAQDTATLFNSYGIAVRSGHHCAKIIDKVIKTSVTVRASLYIYNTKDEIDKFIEVAKKGDDFLEAFFG